MYKNFKSRKTYFMGVAMALIVAGAALIAIGVVEWGSNFWYATSFSQPWLKAIGGLVVLALGYINLELELLRTQ